MKKNLRWLLASSPLLVLALSVGIWGCTKSRNPFDLADTLVPTATVQTLWKNGVLTSTWWGQVLSLTWTGEAPTVASVADSITGDTMALASSISTTTSTLLKFSIPSNVNVGSYIASGHIQFDIQAGSAYSVSGTIWVSNGPYGGGCTTVVPIPTLSPTNFIHVSLPLTSFTNGSVCTSSATPNMGFINIYSFPQSTTGILFYINDLKVTPD